MDLNLLLGGGMDVKTVQARLAHADASITLNRYAHAMPGNDRQAADLWLPSWNIPRRSPGRLRVPRCDHIATKVRKWVWKKKEKPPKQSMNWENLAPLRGLEPPTHGLGNRRSIR